MTFGQKLRRYRILRGLNQKELGVMVGFSDSTADSRIRKYENDIIKPKEDLRLKISNVLGVDNSALSYCHADTVEDMIRILFEMEENYGLRIDSYKDTVRLTFKRNKNSKKLIELLRGWAEQQKNLSIPFPFDDEIREYEEWKAGFPNNINTSVLCNIN